MKFKKFINNSCAILFVVILNAQLVATDLTVDKQGCPLNNLNNSTLKDIRIKMGNNRSEVFTTLLSLYNPLFKIQSTLAPAQKNEQLQSELERINRYLKCGIQKYLPFIVMTKYSPDKKQSIPIFDQAQQTISAVIHDLIQKADNATLNTHLSTIHENQVALTKVINDALMAIDKSVPTKKIDLETIFPGYKDFYTKLTQFAPRNTSKPVETLNMQSTFVFLTNAVDKPDSRIFLDKNKKPLLPETSVIFIAGNQIGKGVEFSKDPQIIRQVKNFAIKLHEIIYALKADTSFENPLSRSKRSTQIKVLEKVLGFIKEGFGIDVSDVIPTQVIQKIDQSKDELAYLILAEALGLYNGLMSAENLIKNTKK